MGDYASKLRANRAQCRRARQVKIEGNLPQTTSTDIDRDSSEPTRSWAGHGTIKRDDLDALATIRMARPSPRLPERSEDGRIMEIARGPIMFFEFQRKNRVSLPLEE